MKKLLTLSAFGILSVSWASAAQITFNDSIAITTTNYASSVTLQKFDTSLGTLNFITFTFSGTVLSTIRVESLDAAPSTITGTGSATLTLKRPDNSILGVVLPSNSSFFNATAFDGTIDFGGTSGRDFGTVTGTSSDSLYSSSASDLLLFSQAGSGTIVLPVTAAGNSSASGAGNLVSSIQTTAGAAAGITYDYTAADVPVPEPTSVVLLSSALGSLLLLRKKLTWFN